MYALKVCVRKRGVVLKNKRRLLQQGNTGTQQSDELRRQRTGRRGESDVELGIRGGEPGVHDAVGRMAAEVEAAGE